MILRISLVALPLLASSLSGQTGARTPAPSPATLAAESQQILTGPRSVDPKALRFEITFPASAHAGPVTGRVYVMLARSDSTEPRMQIGRLGTPFFGRDVERVAPGQPAVIDATDLGHPVWDMRDIPAGEYFVQGFVNV
jgi:hypothetical protein